ncbi:hypothetical protein SPSYN_02245 [Sporotomaculum syntrophicum]|uniref:Uncharacterized protein n=1 Tax=Sporotomaculum syntrophicum TaxID=182264 RepID=A0A9D2WN09_9FIRM|nr:hypothetical protein [Sporotomaculum syntrophicum]KAF1084467.1 hypothetical protein SPSYN_02245 [Sporotomaculum syntrophicum]
MSYQIETKVNKDLSIDPSYIVHYRVTRNGTFVGDGIVEYNRQAVSNDLYVSDNIPPEVGKQLQQQITAAVQHYINQLNQ